MCNHIYIYILCIHKALIYADMQLHATYPCTPAALKPPLDTPCCNSFCIFVSLRNAFTLFSLSPMLKFFLVSLAWGFLSLNRDIFYLIWLIWFHSYCRMEPLEKGALIVSALAHDVGHPGRTNQFFVTCFDPLVSVWWF